MIRRAALVLASSAALVACGSQSGGAAAGPASAGASAATTQASPAVAGVRLRRVGSFDQPVYATAPRGDRRRVFVVEQGGVIRVVRGGRTLQRPFLDVRSRVTNGGEQGLLGLAFAPDYAASGRFYVDFTDRDERQWVVEYRRATADRANPRSARTLMRMVDPEPNHNGGEMQLRAGRPAVHRDRRRRRSERPARRTGNGQNLALAARQDPADRPAAERRAVVHDPARQPVRRRARARVAEIYCLRPAQPVALVASTADRRPRRSATSARTRSRRSTSAGAGPGRGRTSAGGVRGDDRHNADQPAPGAVTPVITHRHDRRLVLDHRRLRRPRPARCPRWTGATSTATSAAA